MPTILNREIDNYWDIPFIGPWPLKIGHIQKLWATPCSPSPMIWVKAFWHDIPWLVWAIIKPEAQDLVSSRFGTGHHTKRKRQFKIVDKTPPRWPVPKNAAGWAAFPVIKATERVGFFLLIVDATLDFAINWQSTAYMWEGCAVEDAYWANGRCTTGPIILPAGSFGPIPIFDEQNQHGFNADINTVDSLVNYDTQVTATINYNVIQGTVSKVQLIDYRSDFIYDAAEPQVGPDGRMQVTLAIRNWTATNPAHSYGIHVESSGPAIVDFTGSFIELYGNRRKGLKWDP